MRKKMMKASMAGVLGVALASTAAFAVPGPYITETDAAAPALPAVNGNTAGVYQKKYIAYEVYDNNLGINADAVNFFVKTGAEIVKGDALNILASPLNYAFAQINQGSGQVFILAKGADIRAATAVTGTKVPVTLSNPCTTGIDPTVWYIIGESAGGGVPQDTVTVNISDTLTFCTRNNLGGLTANGAVIAAAPPLAASVDLDDAAVAALGGTGIAAGDIYTNTGNISVPAQSFISAGHGTISNIAPVGSVTLSVANALNLYIKNNLSPSCTTPKQIRLAYVTSKETIPATTVLEIVPQFAGWLDPNLQAELDTDLDFKKFVAGSNPSGLIQAGNLQIASFIGDNANATAHIINRHLQATDVPATAANVVAPTATALVPTGNLNFKAKIDPTANARIDFTMTSAVAETGLSVKTQNTFNNGGAALAAVACTTTDSKLFNCSNTAAIVADLTNAQAFGFTFTNNGTAEMAPTSWTLTSKTEGSNPGDAFLTVNNKPTCVKFAATNVGNWYGGLEVIVPYVKFDNVFYETFIKLFNRYNKPAKLYVSNMNQVTDAIVTSTTQFSDAALQSIPTGGSVTISGNMLVNNPTTAGAPILTLAEASNGAPVKFLVRVPSQSGGLAGGVSMATNNDPYINGTVVNTFGTGNQKNGQILYKTFKNGQYGNN